MIFEQNDMINISSPQFSPTAERLRVNGGIGLYNFFDFQSTNAVISWGSKTIGNLSLIYKGTTPQTMLILEGETGRIGIGTTDPTALLHVAGDFRSTQVYTNTTYSELVNVGSLLTSENVITDIFRLNSVGTDGFVLTSDEGGNANWSNDISIARLKTHDFVLNSNPAEGYVLTSDEEGIASWRDITSIPGLWTKSETNDDIYRINGNVGIGTDVSFADYKLAVNGKIISEEITVKYYADWPDYVFNTEYKLRGLEETEQIIKEISRLPDVPSAKEVMENGINLGEMNALLLKKIEELTLYTIDQQKIIDKQTKEMNELKNEILMIKKMLIKHN